MTPEEQLLRALVQHPSEDWAPDDELLAGFLDGSLDESTRNRVTAWLAQHPERRRQWLALQETRVRQSRLPGSVHLAAVAVLVVAVALGLQTLRSGTNSDDQPQALIPQSEPATAMASKATKAVPWHAYIQGYLQPQSPYPAASEQERLWHDLGVSLHRLQSHCHDQQTLTSAQQAFEQLIPYYPELQPYQPAQTQAWCSLGETLTQKAKLSVQQEKHPGENP